MAFVDATGVGWADIGTAGVARAAGRTVVWLRGEHDISTVDALANVLARAIAFDDDVVVDLCDVEFMGAATVGVIAL